MEVKIVSLSAWATQVLLDLDLDNWVAGCSHDALIPPDARAVVPVVTRPFDPEKPPPGKLSLTELLLSAWDVDMEKLRELQPSHILTEGLLQMSGLTTEEAEDIFERDGLRGCRLLDFYPMNLKDIFNGIAMIAQTFGSEKKGMLLVEKCHQKLKNTARKFGLRRNGPVIGILRNWPSLQLAGRWLSELVKMTGAVPLIQGDDLFVFPDTYLEDQPEIFIAGSPFASLEENRKKITLLDREELSSVFACEERPSVFVVDGPVFFDHSCVGLDTALKILGEIVKNDPELSKRKGVFWEEADSCQ